MGITSKTVPEQITFLQIIRFAYRSARFVVVIENNARSFCKKNQRKRKSEKQKDIMSFHSSLAASRLTPQQSFPFEIVVA